MTAVVHGWLGLLSSWWCDANGLLYVTKKVLSLPFCTAVQSIVGNCVFQNEMIDSTLLNEVLSDVVNG